MGKCGIIVALMLMATLSACNSSKKNQEKREETASVRTPETEKLLADLSELSSDGCMFGHQDATVYGIGWEGDENRSDVKSVCGDYPAVIGFDLGELELGSDANLDKVPFQQIKKEIVSHYQRGGIVTLSWHARNILTGGDAWDVKDTTVVESILPGGSNHQKFVGWLGRIADFMNSLKTPDGVKIPVLFRPWHEHTGSWFWWGENLCTPEQYKALWEMTYNYFQDKGVNNLLYAYSPGGGCSMEEYMERYPGDEYVDLLGFDYYQGSANDTGLFKKMMHETLQFLTQLGREHHKAIAVTETGLNTLPVENWWTNVLFPVLNEYPVSYVLVWRNARELENHYYAPYPGQASADDFIDFYKNPRTLFLMDVKKACN